jgi:hypothetical protein
MTAKERMLIVVGLIIKYVGIKYRRSRENE